MFTNVWLYEVIVADKSCEACLCLFYNLYGSFFVLMKRKKKNYLLILNFKHNDSVLNRYGLKIRDIYCVGHIYLNNMIYAYRRDVLEKNLEGNLMKLNGPIAKLLVQ